MTDDGASPPSAPAPHGAVEVITSRVARPTSIPGLPPAPRRRHARRRHHLMSLREWATLATIGVLAALLVIAAVIGIVAH